MEITENNLLRLLKYENIETSFILEKISNLLKIQFFRDGNVYTLGSKYFVLDINEKLTISYVDETMSDCFKYVEYYLSFFYEEKNFFEFFCFLKYYLHYLDVFLSAKSLSVETKIYKEEQCTLANFCPCIRNFKYCNIYFYSPKKDKYFFNVFTHRYEYHYFSNIFVTMPMTLHNKIDTKDSILNLAECYPSYFFTSEVLNYFFQNISVNLCYKNIILDLNIFVDKNGKIFINEKYDKKLSFLFKNGLSLQGSIECLQNLS